jgi:hypothetical protein
MDSECTCLHIISQRIEYQKRTGPKEGNSVPEPCPFYKIKVTILRNKTNSSNRNSTHPHTSRQEYCAPLKSKHPRNTIGPSVPCGGDLEKCVIPPEDRR